MINNNYSIVISKLIDATKENRCSWSRTSRQNEFSVEVGEYTLAIAKSTAGLFPLSGKHSEVYGLSLLNNESELMDFQEIKPEDEDYQKAINLFLEAQRSYYNVDSVLQDILKEL